MIIIGGRSYGRFYKCIIILFSFDDNHCGGCGLWFDSGYLFEKKEKQSRSREYYERFGKCGQF